MVRLSTYVVAILNNRFRNFFVYQSIEACILGTLCYIGMRIFDFPYAATISILIGFSAMIPVVGAYIGVTIGTILIMTHSVTLALLLLPTWLSCSSLKEISSILMWLVVLPDCLVFGLSSLSTTRFCLGRYLGYVGFCASSCNPLSDC